MSGKIKENLRVVLMILKWNISTDYIYKVPESSTKAGAKRLSIFLPKCFK